jgi:hypothetical protein
MQDSRKLEKIKNFVTNYGINEVSVDIKDSVVARPYTWNDMTYSPEQYFNTERINVYKMSLPEKSLEKIVETVTEYDNLMRDPETRRLLMEAKFIHSLKYGTTF